MSRRGRHDAARMGRDAGMALLAVLLLMTLVAALGAGFSAVVLSEKRLQTVDRDRTDAFYAAHGALEKLTSDLGVLFSTTYAPRGSQITALEGQAPIVPGVRYVTTNEGPGYDIAFAADADGNPTAVSRTITTGPYEGFTGLMTPYTLSVTASTGNIGEVRLQRQLQTVSIPVFQFGIFSEVDLSFFAGPDFAFGGRVHTNGSLYLASGATLTLADRVTARGEVIRTNLSNGWATSSGYTGNVRIIKAPGSYRNLARTEGSLVGTIGTAVNEPAWTNLSITTYHANIRNGRTGARQLDLPLVTIGATPIDMIRRPEPSESTEVPLYPLRYYGLASLRILLADTPGSITTLPASTAGAPVELGATMPGWYTVDAAHPRFALSRDEGGYHMTHPGSPLLGGVVKIDMQDRNGVWHDVTAEILGLGIGGRNLSVAGCANVSPDAVVRFQRVRDVPSAGGSCGTNPSSTVLQASDFWPNVLYDTREGNLRDNITTSQTTVFIGGAMHYVELDARNLARWFRGEIGTSGPQAMDVTGHVVYFSDRRGNRDAAGAETGEYGNEDFVNPASAAGVPNATLDGGEDVNGNGQLDRYGRTAVAPVGLRDNTFLGWTPDSLVDGRYAKMNPALFFRRALKLVNGGPGNLPDTGLTVVSENPVYIQGNWNASGSFVGAHVATSVIADAVTLLSNNWNDHRSFLYPHNPGLRPGTETWYRLAIIAGKGPSFQRPTAGSPYQDFGTDGGVHNFLRLLEDWNGTIHYRGSLATFYFNRQAVGTFKCCTNVYNPSTRDYQFDLDFLTPALLPPRTPMFRDVNAIGFTQVLTPPR